MVFANVWHMLGTVQTITKDVERRARGHGLNQTKRSLTSFSLFLFLVSELGNSSYIKYYTGVRKKYHQSYQSKWHYLGWQFSSYNICLHVINTQPHFIVLVQRQGVTATNGMHPLSDNGLLSDHQCQQNPQIILLTGIKRPLAYLHSAIMLPFSPWFFRDMICKLPWYPKINSSFVSLMNYIQVF
jgi:hypothetical protein